jgi:hypothetical protein
MTIFQYIATQENIIDTSTYLLTSMNNFKSIYLILRKFYVLFNWFLIQIWDLLTKTKNFETKVNIFDKNR